jgi:hypothetical protein
MDDMETVSYTPICLDKKDDHFYANHNPLYAGILILNLRTMTEELGVSVASHNHVLFGMCHLYNALHQLKLTELEWPELEKIIAMHPGPLFANDIPATPDAMAKRMAFRLGTGVTLNTFATKNAKEFPPSAATQILKPFFRENGSLGRSIHLLEEQVKEKEQLRLAAGSSAGNGASGTQSQVARRRSRALATRQLTPLQFITQLENHLPTLISDMQIDYFSITILCHTILKNIRTALIEKFKCPTTTLSDGAGLAFMIATVLDHTAKAKRSIKGKFDGGELLLLCRDVFEKVVGNHLVDD